MDSFLFLFLFLISPTSPCVESVDLPHRTPVVSIVQRRDVIVIVVVGAGRRRRVAYAAEGRLVLAGEPVVDGLADAGPGHGRAQVLEVDDDPGHGEMVRRRLVEARLTPGGPGLVARERYKRAVAGC